MRNQKNKPEVHPEFSRPFDLTRLAPGGGEVHERLSASPEECKALAGRFGILDVSSLEGLVRLRRMKGKVMRLRVSGHLAARVVQECVVSLAPVAEEVDEDFTIVFTDEPMQADAAVGLEDDSEPADFGDGKLDLGEMLAQQLSLSLNPYPRAQDVEINAQDVFEGLQTE